MEKIGLFVNGDLISEYPHTYEGGFKALNEAKECTSESGYFHEVKIYDGVCRINKKKTLHVIEATLLSLKDDLHFYHGEEDEKGTDYTMGRIHAVEQIIGLIKDGRLD